MKYEIPTYESIAIFSRKIAEDLKRPDCDGTFDDYKELREAYMKHHELIAEACEKQIAQKTKSKDLDFPECKCGRFLISYYGELFSYCPDCGQKADHKHQRGDIDEQR